VIGRETGSWLWSLVSFLSMTTLAWLAACVVYQAGTMIGL
jgi:Fe2+ transport system protein B